MSWIKYQKTFSVSTEFIDIARFIISSLSNLVDNLMEKKFTKSNVKIVITFLNMKVSMTI